MRRASWNRFAGAAALLVLYSLWFALSDSPMTRALAEAGALPELRFGFHSGEPMTAIDALSAARGDYLWMQAYDLVFVALLVMTALSALALATGKRAIAPARLKLAMLIPLAFAGAELLENSLLALFAAEIITPSAPLAFLQQAATTAKSCLGAFTVLLAFSFVAALSGEHANGRTSA